MASIKRKYISLLIGSMVLLEVCFGIILELPLAEAIQVNMFLILVLIGYEFTTRYQTKTGVITGFSFFLTFWTVWLVFAWIGKYYFIANDNWRARNESIHFSKYFNLNFLAVVSFIAAYNFGFIFSKLKIRISVNGGSDKNSDSAHNGDLIKTNIYLNIAACCCIAVALLFYYRMGGLTIFYGGNIDEYRFQVQNQSAIFNYINYIIPLLMIIKICVMRVANIRKIGDILIILGMFFVEFVYGSKMLFIFPAVVSFCLIYMDQRKDILKLGNIIVLAIGVLVCVVYTNYRGLGQAISNSLLEDIFLFVGGEFRDATRFLTFVDQNDLQINTVQVAIVKCIPGGIRALFDLDQYIWSIGSYVKTSLGYTFSGGSTRIGLLAEMYTYGRTPAVIIGFAIIGFVLARIDKSIDMSDDIWKKAIRMIAIFQITWFLLAETYIQLPALVIYLLLYLIVQIGFVVSRMIRVR